jgi:hypothetical protein
MGRNAVNEERRKEVKSFSRGVYPSGRVCRLLQEVTISVDREANKFLSLMWSDDWVGGHAVGVVVQLLFMAASRVFTTQGQEQRTFVKSFKQGVGPMVFE